MTQGAGTRQPEPADEAWTRRTAGVRVYSERYESADRHVRRCLLSVSLAPAKLAKRRTGKVRGTIGDRRTETDFVSFLETLFASAPPMTAWEVVCDNLPRTCRKAWLAWSHSSSVSPMISGRRGNPASSSLWRPARGVPARSHSPDLFPLHPQTCLLLAQPDRELVLNPRPQAPPPWQLHVQGASPAEDRELYRLLQCHHGQAGPLDNERQAAGSVTCSSGFGVPARCTRTMCLGPSGLIGDIDRHL
jgi:hypothetical protein